jgi:hypothetical protein
MKRGDVEGSWSLGLALAMKKKKKRRRKKRVGSEPELSGHEVSRLFT